MKRLFTVTCLIFALFISLVPLAAQGNPDITSFSTSFTSIGRDALQNRTARIPVTWTTSNRPFTANLVFEQVFPDGSTINVELPRVIPFVASNGNGTAAPILPSANASTIVLRVSLINLFSHQIYDTAEITIPVVDGAGGAGNSLVPTITAFSSNGTSSVDRVQLSNGDVRIPVSWSAINRPVTANLVFEQILPDGTAVNVELPRPFLWVNSTDSGIVAPIAPNGDADEIVLRLRLIDLLFNRVLDQKILTVPITSSDSTTRINYFTTSTSSMSSDELRSGTARVTVSWEVLNRPNNTNLVFEQVLPDGTLRNVELPRQVQIVSSSGTGQLAPIMPTQPTEHLIFQLRLVNLANGQTISNARLQLPLINSNSDEIVVVTGDACYRSPFPASQGLEVGGQARVQRFYGSPSSSSTVSVYSDLTNFQVLGELAMGDVVRIEAAPYCSYFYESDGTTVNRRRWNISSNGVRGWIDEYNQGDPVPSYYIVPAANSDIPLGEIISFNVNPSSIDSAALDSTYVTFSWQTRNTTRVYISPMPSETNQFSTSGELRILASQLQANSNPITYTLTAHDGQQNYSYAEVTITFNSGVGISSFSVSPDTARGNQQVTFSWNITGDFDTASIWYTPSVSRPSLTNITTISSNTGNFAFTLPDFVSGQHRFTLTVDDGSGALQNREVTVNITCAYDWGSGISNSDCPRQAMINRQAAYQAFQRGFMIWLPVNSGQEMWVFYNDGTVNQYPDAWNGADYIIDSPPDGLIAPERGFGYLWNTTPSVRSGLGWAIAEEQSYTAQYQSTLSAVRYSDVHWYLSLPDGRLVRVSYSIRTSGLQWAVN